MVGGLATYFRRTAIEKTEISVSQTLKQRFFTELLQRKLSVWSTEHSASLSQQLTKDLPEVANNITTEFATMLRGGIFFIGGTLLLLYHCPSIIALSVIPLTILIILAKRYGARMRRDRAALAALHRQLSAFTLERFKQIRTVKLFSAETLESQNFAALQREIQIKTLQVASYSAGFFAGLEFIAEQILLIGGGISVYLLQNNPQLNIGNLTALASYGMYSGMGFRLLLSSYAELKKAAGVYSNISDLIRNPDSEEVLLHPGATEYLSPGVSISLKSLSFTYPGREVPAVSGVSIEIASGQILGIVGPSGHGKSTLLNLLALLYVPSRGQVLVDGVDACTRPSWWLRQKIAAVSQEALLFSASILENVRYSKPSASVEAAREACRRADALEFIDKLPEGMQTRVGESGVLLSGGQRQRICIARALLKEPQLLLLDEATSGVDFYSESVIQGVIEREVFHKKFSVVVVTHRVTSLQALVDKLVVIENGVVRAQGTYEELVADESLLGLFKV